MASRKTSLKAHLHQTASGSSLMTRNSSTPTSSGLTAPFVTDWAGWRAALKNLKLFDTACLVRRLDDFRALTAATPIPAAWVRAAAAAVLEHVKLLIESTLRKNTHGDNRAFLTARSIAIGAITDVESCRYDGLRHHFEETLHHITRDAERHERGPLLSAHRFVSLELVADMPAASEEEVFLSRDAILRAIGAEPRAKRRIALALKYQGFSDAEIGEKVGVSAQRVNVYVRDFARSPLLAEFRDGLSSRRKQ